MKHILFAALVVFPLAAGAQMKGMDMKDMDMKGIADAKVHRAKGTVSKVDAKAGTITINHEPVASMNWPSMNMAFKVKDKKVLETVKPGQKVDFSFSQSGKDYVIAEIKSN